MANYFVFTDEAGAYQSHTSSAFRKSHPFYIRANVLMSMEDYRVFQEEMKTLNAMYEIPIEEEIKWADLWSLHKGNPRTLAIGKMKEDRLKGYYRKAFEIASSKESLKYIFTITNVHEQYCLIESKYVYKFHLQEAFQRIKMHLRISDFAVFIMDELNDDVVKQIKETCYDMTMSGDFLEYKNIYHGVLVENSIYCPGIQLADYAAGVMFGFLRGKTVNPGRYELATEFFETFIRPKIRCDYRGKLLGYGIREVPSQRTLREHFEKIFGDRE